jgi:NADH-quinone oxidoreductase subunit C
VTALDAAAIHGALHERFGEAITAFEAAAPQPYAVVDTTALAAVASFAKDEPALRFDNLMCLSAVDYPKETPPYLELVYHLLSYEHGHRFILKTRLPRDAPQAPSVEGVWAVANWHEREAFDLFGIRFDGHGDLRRILLPEDWSGHPLRKDWTDPDFYNGLHVKPTPQMAERFLAGEAIGVGPFEFTPPNLSPNASDGD